MANREFVIHYSVVERDLEQPASELNVPIEGSQVLEIAEEEADLTTVADIFAEVEEAILENVFGESS